MVQKRRDQRSMFVVVHPLNDVDEVKRDPAGLGPMRMRGGTRIALMALRGYLIVMAVLVVYHFLALAGALG